MEKNDIICTGCPKGCRVTVEVENEEIINIEGYECPTGKKYAIDEYKNPTRILPTTIRVKNGEFPLVPVKTAEPIPKSLLIKAMDVIAKKEVEAPVKIGDILIKNILDTGVNVVATRNINKKVGV
ncbi:MAG: DUF1667 domain-containing protein [Halanaerobiales bacterium]|nr:DUF1667 domain-containing protein [Halanaerobiales bacterium]